MSMYQLDDWQKNGDPSQPGWYAIKREDGSLCLRAWGNNGGWWIPLKDGWFSGLTGKSQWLGPLAEIDWDTPAVGAYERDAARYRAIRDSDDESVIDSIYPFSTWENTHWLKRGDALDKFADAACSPTEQQPKDMP